MVAWGMAGRRTLQEKKVAELRRRLSENQDITQLKLVRTPSESNFEKSVINRSYYYPELLLPINLVRSDLTKTVGVTILALISQMVLATYLNKGGWQVILKFFLRGGD